MLRGILLALYGALALLVLAAMLHPMALGEISPANATQKGENARQHGGAGR